MRVSVYFEEQELRAIRELAERDRRDPRDQVAYLALKALQLEAPQKEVAGEDFDEARRREC